MYVLITDRPISIEQAVQQLDLRGLGGIVTFSGVTRPTDARGRELTHIDYEAYQPMAELYLRQLGDEARAQWGVKQVAILHRVGRVAIGDPSVVIVAAAEHRKEAFRACEFVIDRLKVIVPIWKKEVLKPEVKTQVVTVLQKN
jgi:molybdopterin synthase catalytic subunit